MKGYRVIVQAMIGYVDLLADSPEEAQEKAEIELVAGRWVELSGFDIHSEIGSAVELDAEETKELEEELP